MSGRETLASPRLWILTFHGLGEPSARVPREQARYWVSPERFGRILDALARRPEVHITFDDGNASDAEEALPLLRERGLSASFFPCAGTLGQSGYCTPGQIRELAAAGMAVGSHGWGHRPWRGLDEAGSRQELEQARSRLEDVLGGPVRSAACPFGAYDRRSLARLRAAGFERVYTSDGGPSRPGAWLRPRTTVLAEHEPADLARIMEEGQRLTARAARAARGLLKRWR